MTLQPIKRAKNTFCAPAVLAALANVDTDTAAKMLSDINGEKEITGVYLRDLLLAINKVGYKNEWIRTKQKTLFTWLLMDRPKDGIYLVMILKHFILIEVDNPQVNLLDNHTKSSLRIASSARLNQRLISIYRLTR